MVDQVYTDARNNFLGNGTHGESDLDTDDIRIGLYDEGTTARSMAHVDHAEVVGAFVTNGETANLAGKDVGTIDGVFNHNDTPQASVSGATVESLLYFEWDTASATSPLLFVLDGWTGLPLTPNGGTVNINPAAGGVFGLPAS